MKKKNPEPEQKDLISPSERSDSAAESAEVVVLDPPIEERQNVLPFPIVGIGGSAGGLEAFVELLQNTPADTGMAFVILSHLPPHHRSLLPEILGRTTVMPVTEIENGKRPEPNHVYVIPSASHVVLANGVFNLQARPEREMMPRPFDLFFRSLGQQQKSRAVGIILSGSDSDGALGLRAIKGDGGFAIVQDERTAKFESMPRSAIAADHVDLVLSPRDIGLELGRIARDLKSPNLISPPVPAGADEERCMAKIYSALRTISGIDFNRYKQTTVRRRIARRMVLKKMATLDEYARLLQSQSSEARDLYEEALIGVTRFFRDPEVFDALKSEVFPLILKHRAPGAPVRIWVPGCATGEEVYSIAICLAEYLGNLTDQTPIHIFGTDVSERSIDRARLASYPETVAGEIHPGRITRFFTRTEGGYHVNKRIRDNCIFARHNLIQDPPYSRLDLISCRNVLIYLGAQAQKHAISAFHYGLKQTGVLLLGQSEAIREYPDLFSLTDRRNKFYTRQGGASRIHVDILPHSSASGLSGAVRDAKLTREDGLSDVDLQRATDRIVIARHGPPGVVVDEKMNVVQTRGDTSEYLMLAPGSVNLNVFRMAKDGLGQSIRDALSRAIDDEIPVVVPGLCRRSDRASVTLEVLPVPNPQSQHRYFLVLFKAQEGSGSATSPADFSYPVGGDEKDKEIARLRRDLASTKTYLQTLIEERDARNQELVSANEEIQSSNEELQSINEELETAKEELQSQTEELQTVNEELHRRNEQLTRASSDLVNLLNNITMPVLILGADLHIRQFTPLAERVLSIRAADVGRHMREIRLNLRVEGLEKSLIEVLDTLNTRELEVEDFQGHWYLLRARPYRSVDNRIDGVVVVLIEIDQMRVARQELKAARDFATSVIESIPIPLVVLDAELRVRLANHAFLDTAQLRLDEVLKHAFPDLVDPLWQMTGIQSRLANLLLQEPDGGSLAFEHTYGERPRTLLVHARAVHLDGSLGVIIVIEDITSRHNAQVVLQEEKDVLAEKVEETETALSVYNRELQRLTASLFAAQEDERRRVARDLHDDLAQHLAMLEMQVEQLEQNAGPDETVREGLTAIHRKANDLADGLRRVAHELHPQILEDLGLAVAIERLAKEFESRVTMPVEYVARGVPPDLSPIIATSIYRVTQEALRNISRHAGDTPVEISLTGIQEELRLVIRDQGLGFDTTRIRRGEGLGLVSMEERARLLGGELKVTSSVGNGTTVEVRIPLVHKSQL